METNANVHRLTSHGISIFFKKHPNIKQRKGAISTFSLTLIVMKEDISDLNGTFLFAPKKYRELSLSYHVFYAGRPMEK